MLCVNEILNSLFALAPPNLAESWDNNGLVVGRFDAPVSRVLVALDCNLTTLQEAAEKNCQMIVSHHPVIFGNLQQVNNSSVTGRAVLFAIEHSIACANLHTCLDKTLGGVNDILAEKVGLADISAANEDPTAGYLRMGTVREMDIKTFAGTVKNALGSTGIRFADGGKPVHKVAVGGGACGSEIPVALACGCDTLVTADLKYNQFCDAKELGINLVDAGHFETESPVCQVLCQYLLKTFPQLEVILSEKQESPISFL